MKLEKLKDDPWLDPYRGVIEARKQRVEELEERLTQNSTSLADFASGHEYFGMHKNDSGWIFREWAPNAEEIFLVGDFSDWKESADFALTRINNHNHWEIKLPKEALHHGDLYRLKVKWDGGDGDRIPAYVRRVVQDEETKIFNAQVWAPETPYKWNNSANIKVNAPIIYESHVGMAQDKECVGSYCEFRRNILPRIADAGYNTIQLMAIMEHPYYGSFGYHVSSFFAASSRFGTPEELKELIDEAHSLGLAVIIDLVHSHSVKNEVEGLSCFDGTKYQYFHEGEKGYHKAWDSCCFNYSKSEVLHFLLSNCRYWLDEYHLDGFRFDGVTSMLYYDHGLGEGFNSYDDYFSPDRVDEEAFTYLMLANKLIHDIRPSAITVAEDVSGMPGLGAPVADGGLGFDYKLAMGIPDFWFKLLKEVKDDDWNMDDMWQELTNRRRDEKSIAYVECHDQSIVGGKTVIFELIDAEMYHAMSIDSNNLTVERGIALHKMLRLATFATAGHGYLNFIGNEFGHPEWVDFPREGNNWSCKYARRQWRLRDDPDLKYHFLADFDKKMVTSGIKFNIFDNEPEVCYSHCNDQILAFRRGPLVFIFNFSPSNSVSDYFIDVTPGKYHLLFESDKKEFGGHDRIASGQQFPTVSHNGRTCIQLYLPCRTAMVLFQ